MSEETADQSDLEKENKELRMQLFSARETAKWKRKYYEEKNKR